MTRTQEANIVPSLWQQGSYTLASLGGLRYRVSFPHTRPTSLPHPLQAERIIPIPGLRQQPSACIAPVCAERGLTKNMHTLEVRALEDIGATLGCGGDDLGGVDLNEPLACRGKTNTHTSR